jgi:hypothetical protein
MEKSIYHEKDMSSNQQINSIRISKESPVLTTFSLDYKHNKNTFIL